MRESPRQQHQRAIHIAPAARSAGTDMPAFAQRLFHHRIARHDTAGRVSGSAWGPRHTRHQLLPLCIARCQGIAPEHCRESLCSAGFGCCTVGKILLPSSVLLRLRAAYQVGRLQLFGENRRCSIHHRSGLFVVEVQSLPGHLAVQLRHPLVGQAPTMRELLLRISGLVRRFQRGLALTKKTRICSQGLAHSQCWRWWQTSRHPNQRRWSRHHATAQADTPAQSRHTSGHACTRYRTSWARQSSAHPHGSGHARYQPTAAGHAAYPPVARSATHHRAWDSSIP